jgi:hypothetical protein
VYYGHAPKAVLSEGTSAPKNSPKKEKELFALVQRIMREIDRGRSLEAIAQKTHAEPSFIEDVARMYLTHKNVGVQGILDRIEIKGM